MWQMPGVVPSSKKSICASTNALLSGAKQKMSLRDKLKKAIFEFQFLRMRGT